MLHSSLALMLVLMLWAIAIAAVLIVAVDALFRVLRLIAYTHYVTLINRRNKTVQIHVVESRDKLSPRDAAYLLCLLFDDNPEKLANHDVVAVVVGESRTVVIRTICEWARIAKKALSRWSNSPVHKAVSAVDEDVIKTAPPRTEQLQSNHAELGDIPTDLLLAELTLRYPATNISRYSAERSVPMHRLYASEAQTLQALSLIKEMSVVLANTPVDGVSDLITRAKALEQGSQPQRPTYVRLYETLESVEVYLLGLPGHDKLTDSIRETLEGR